MMAPLARLVTALADRYRLERELGQGGMATVGLEAPPAGRDQSAEARARRRPGRRGDLSGVRGMYSLSLADDPHVYAYGKLLYTTRLYTVDGVR